MSKGKDAEAFSLMKSAKKHHTKSITKWSVSGEDWQSASEEYEKAAKIFTHCENVKMATEAWRAASHAHDKAGNGFFAGKSLETLAQFLADVPAPSDEAAADERRGEVTKCYIDAGQLYALANKPDRQAQVLKKAASTTGKKNAPQAAKLMRQAIDTLEDNEKFHSTLDLYRALLLTQLRGEMWAEAISTLKKQNNAFKMLDQAGNAPKCGLEIVVIALYTGDWVLADREFRDCTQNMYAFAHSKEQVLAYELVAAVEDRDADRLSEALKDQTISFLVNDIARMAKKIRVTGCANIPPPKKTAPTVGSASMQQQQETPEKEEKQAAPTPETKPASPSGTTRYAPPQRPQPEEEEEDDECIR